MLETTFSPWPSFSEAEAAAVQQVLLSNRVNYWTGEQGSAFEREFADWCETRYAVAVANGTVALDLAWIALGLRPGDEVVVTPRTFFASVASIVNAGAVPVFADVDRDSQNITSESVAPVVTPKTRAILTVHLSGWPCEMDGLMELAASRDLSVVEDCAQAHGARYHGRSVGTLGDIGAWSFCQDKIMTTGGEGGMVTTDDQDYWSEIWSYKDHGKSWVAMREQPRKKGFRWVHHGFGTNWRLTEMQSAIGRIQLQQMPDWHALRTHNANTLLDACRNLAALRTPEIPDHIEHGWYKFYAFARLDALKSGWSRDRIVEEINARGVPCYSGSCPEVYLEAAFEGTAFRPAERLPAARELGETSLMFLVHPTLTAAEINRCCAAIRDVAQQAQR